MIKAVNEVPKGFKSPVYEKVRTTMLSDEKLDLEAKLSPIRNSRRISGVSIIFDGWKDQRNRPLINVIAQNRKGAMFFKVITDNAKEIQAFITNHHMSQGIYKEFAKLELLKVVETLFVFHIIVLTRLMQVKHALQSIVCSSLWNQWRQSQSDRAQAVKKLVVDDKWWDC